MREVFFSQDHPALFGETLVAECCFDSEGFEYVRFGRADIGYLVRVAFLGAHAMFEDGGEYVVVIGKPKEEDDGS